MHFHFHSFRSRLWSRVRIWTLDPDSRPGSNSLWQRSVCCECSSYPCNAVYYYLQYTRTDGKSDRNLPNFFVFFFFCEPVLFSFLAAQEQTTANTRHKEHTHTHMHTVTVIRMTMTIVTMVTAITSDTSDRNKLRTFSAAAVRPIIVVAVVVRFNITRLLCNVWYSERQHKRVSKETVIMESISDRMTDSFSTDTHYK